MGGSGLSAPFWGVCVHCWAVALLRAAVGTQECTQIGENKTFGWFSYGLCTLSSRWAHRAGVRRSEQPLSPLCDDRDGHAALRGAPAPPVPCHVAAGEVGGSVFALELAVPVRVSENAATLIPGRLRGAMARPERLRRAVGRGRGGRPLPRRTRQDEGGSPRARGRCSRRPGAPRTGTDAARAPRRPPARRGRPGRCAWRRRPSRCLGSISTAQLDSPLVDVRPARRRAVSHRAPGVLRAQPVSVGARLPACPVARTPVPRRP